MMSEWMIITLIGGGTILWPWGGTGPKLARRIVWPVIIASVLVISGLTLGRSLMVGFAVAVIAALPYGDRTPSWLRPLVFASYGIPAVIIHPNVLSAILFPLVSCGLLMALFLASHRWNWFTHKIFESGCGFIQGSTLVCAVLMR